MTTMATRLPTREKATREALQRVLEPCRIVGRKIGRLTVEGVEGTLETPSGKRLKLWRCRCECGNIVLRRSSQLSENQEYVASCGCTRSENNYFRTHGMSKTAPEYGVWKAMIRRCENPNVKDYPAYGGRGLTVCDRWHSFPYFIADMGPRPTPNHSIDRKDNELGYFPENCRWATPVEQRRNQRRYIRAHPEFTV